MSRVYIWRFCSGAAAWPDMFERVRPPRSHTAFHFISVIPRAHISSALVIAAGWHLDMGQGIQGRQNPWGRSHETMRCRSGSV